MIPRLPSTGFLEDAVENLDVNGNYKPDAGGPGIPGFVQSNLLFFSDAESYVDCDNRPSCCSENESEAEPQCVQGPYGWTWRIYYDLHDANIPEPVDAFYPNDGSGILANFGNFDNVHGGGFAGSEPNNHVLTRTMFWYLGGGHTPEHPNYDDRGIEKADLVDILDGMACLGFMSATDAMMLLHGVMDFEYDFLPDVGSCALQ